MSALEIHSPVNGSTKGKSIEPVYPPRHFNATMMDAKNVPVKTRQTRLGHDDPRITLGMRNRSGYTHMVSEDDRRVAAMFGEIFGRVLCPDVSGNEKAPTHQISGAV